MEAQLARWKGHWSFFDAVNGWALSREETEARYDQAATIREMGRPLSPGEIGCALSHAGIYRLMAERGIERALVLEDDVVIHERFFDFPYERIDWPFDVITFYSGNTVVRRRSEHQVGGVAFHRPVWESFHTPSYLVSLEGARKLAAANTPVVSDADWPLNPPVMRFYVARPFFIAHTHHDSLLHDERRELKFAWLKSRSPFAAFVERYLPYVAFPTFLVYALNPDRYHGVRDYCYRELLRYVLRLWPFAYISIREPELQDLPDMGTPVLAGAPPARDG